MRFIEFLVEQGETEIIHRDTTTANRLAGELLRGAQGNKTVAKKMAQSFLQNLLASIEDQDQFARMKSAGGGRTQQSYRTRPTGYDARPETPSAGVSEYA